MLKKVGELKGFFGIIGCHSAHTYMYVHRCAHPMVISDFLAHLRKAAGKSGDVTIVLFFSPYLPL